MFNNKVKNIILYKYKISLDASVPLSLIDKDMLL